MKVLLATDGSRHLAETALWVRRFLQESPSTQLIVVYVSDVKVPYYQATELGVQERISDEERAFVVDLSNRVRQLFYPWRDQVCFRHVIGHPVDTICKMASRENVDFIIVGKHGTAATEKLVGRTSQGVLDRAQVPVLVVR